MKSYEVIQKAVDEPGVKAVFSLAVETPEGQMSVSNMPVEDAVTPPGGQTTVYFADSPRMSSYLLFMALGDFERVSQKVAGVDVGVVVPVVSAVGTTTFD